VRLALLLLLLRRCFGCDVLQELRAWVNCDAVYPIKAPTAPLTTPFGSARARKNENTAACSNTAHRL
jgi:hypothetical protein